VGLTHTYTIFLSIAANGIYVGCNDLPGIHTGLQEILTAVIQPHNEILTGVVPNTPPCFPTSFYDVVASVDLFDYLVTGEVWNQSTNQSIVSSASEGTNLCFAFYQASTFEIIIKKAASPGAPFIRKSNSEAQELSSVSTTWLVNTFPNPSSGTISISSTQKIGYIRISDVLGRTVQELHPDTIQELHKIEISTAGLYHVLILSETGEVKMQNVLIRK